MNEIVLQRKAPWVRNGLCFLAGCLVIWYFTGHGVVQIAERILEMIVKVDTVRLDHEYSLEVYQDQDIWQFYAQLKGPDESSARVMLNEIVQAKDPIFIVGKTSDGKIGWVVTKKHPDTLICVIDYQNGDYWIRGEWGKWSDKKENTYLTQINADGGHYGFALPYYE